MNFEFIQKLLEAKTQENEVVEYKQNNKEINTLAKNISALSNTAALLGIDKAYLVFGIEDKTLKIVGTKFKPKKEKKGNEELESWLHKALTPNIEFTIHEISKDEINLVVFEIDATKISPIKFEEKAYIRIGSNTKQLDKYPEKEKKLWQVLSGFSFETEIAKSNLNIDDIYDLLDCQKCLNMLKIPYNDNVSHDYVIENLIKLELVKKINNSFAITNLGAILFARDLTKFESLDRKRIRFIRYKGKGKIDALEELEGKKGYAIGFKGLISYIMKYVPKNEVIENAIRKDTTLYPEIAIRELVANAIIHQDFTIDGRNPMIEMYSDRIEITNNGKSLIDIKRLIDMPSKSRNDKLANLMRIMGICEERGSGVDKVIDSVEFYQLPAPEFTNDGDYFQAILFSYMPLEDMTKQDRIRATYQHCCLKWASRDVMTNASLRARFKIGDKQHSKASKIISDTLEVGLIKQQDPENKSTKHTKYVPYFV
ncbi:putative transcriptional regulator (AlbA domain) [Campylobacter sp. RM5004]|uniref:AlbA family DNA-binding domain-containing protein n=1 Tax=Campylobacter sp. RM5004 TaxID=1660078 RepID=UPI001EFA6A5D|nr:helix-turn-helix domain-containing protein [Campylobacter sp. RM5004]ULO00741.1 putative transcriptional regulator (AlbA domain) [Campylobacter sp. RM5004]